MNHSKVALDFEVLLEDLERWQFQRRVPAKFRAVCKRQLTLFNAFLLRTDTASSLADVTQKEVRSFLSSGSTKSYGKQREAFRSVRELFTLLIDRDLLTSNPTDGVWEHLEQKKPNGTLSPSEVGSVFRFIEAQEPASANGIRAEVIVCLLYFDLLLLSELLAIKLRDLNLPTGTLSLVNGRTVALSRETRAAIAALVAMSGGSPEPSTSLLRSRWGRPLAPKPIKMLMAKLTEAAGVSVTATRLRKSGTRHMLDQGQTVQMVRRLSGRPRSDALIGRIAIDPEAMLQALRSLHPRYTQDSAPRLVQLEHTSTWLPRRIAGSSQIRGLATLPSVEDVETYLDILDADAENEEVAMRYRVAALHHSAVSELAYSSGLAPLYLARLRKSELDTSHHAVTVQGKVELRVVPITPIASRAVSRWLLFAEAHAPISEWVFPRSTGRQSTGKDLSSRHRAHIARLGLSFTLHDLRRLFAFHLWSVGFDERYLAYMLGLVGNKGISDVFRHGGAAH